MTKRNNIAVVRSHELLFRVVPITKISLYDFYFDMLLSTNFFAHNRPRRFAKTFLETKRVDLIPSGVLARIPCDRAEALKT